MSSRKLKLTKKQRAEMPAQHGLAGVLAKVHKQRRHRNKKKYDRKRVKDGQGL